MLQWAVQTVASLLPLPWFPSRFPQLRYEAWVSVHIKRTRSEQKYTFSFCFIWKLVTLCQPLKRWDELGKCMDFSRTCVCIYTRIISVLVFNGSPLLSFSDEVSPCMEWLPRKRKRGRTNPQHDWLLSPPSPLFISTTISGIFINPHGSMCLGVVKIDKWLIRIPPFYFPTD